MIKSVQDAAYLRLIEAMYRRAKIDYYEALALYDIGKRREVEKFFLNDPYIYTKEQGEDIIETCKNKVEKARKLIEDFLASGVHKIDIPPGVDTDAIDVLCRKLYTNVYYRIDKKRFRGSRYMPMLVRRKKHDKSTSRNV